MRSSGTLSRVARVLCGAENGDTRSFFVLACRHCTHTERYLGVLGSRPKPMPSLVGALAFFTLGLVAHYRIRSERLKIALLLAVGIAMRVFVALQSPLVLQDWPLNDDSHYYFTIARNIVHGFGVRHDSAHITTGFQPLFLILILPLFEVVHDKLFVINAVLLLQSAVGVCCALLLYRLARFVGGAAVALVALGIWATSATLLTADLNGLETNTSLCLLLATLCLYVRDFVVGDASSTCAFARLGAMCGLSFLARVDLGLLIPVLTGDLLLRGYRRTPRAMPFRQLVVMNATAALAVSPWVLFNLITIRSVLPSSGQAVRFLAQAYGYRFIGGSGPAFEVGHAPLAYYLLTTLKAARESAAVLHGTFPLWAAVLCIGYAIATSGQSFLLKQRPLYFLGVFLGTLFLAYSWYIFGQWFLKRYLVPLTIGYVLIVVSAAREVVTHATRKPPFWRHALMGLGMFALACSMFRTLQDVSATVARDTPSGYYEAAVWVNENTPKQALIGAYQTGILGYYLERRFHGLDGKINVLSLDAMRSKSMDLYVKREKIDYLMDWPWILDDLFVKRARDPLFLAKQRKVRQGFYDMYELDSHP